MACFGLLYTRNNTEHTIPGKITILQLATFFSYFFLATKQFVLNITIFFLRQQCGQLGFVCVYGFHQSTAMDTRNLGALAEEEIAENASESDSDVDFMPKLISSESSS
jgi:hypothetical protein